MALALSMLAGTPNLAHAADPPTGASDATGRSDTPDATAASTPDTSAPSVILGLDHIPLAVRDLESAAKDFRALGFAIKPGRPHDNGIQNQHIKFPNGTEIELITAPEARDELTTQYRAHLEKGDGPAFAGLTALSVQSAVDRLSALRIDYKRQGSLVSFPPRSALSYLFIGNRNRSPTDKPEHFAHTNSAEALIALWIAPDDPSVEISFLKTLGAEISERIVYVPDKLTGTVAHFADGDVYVLPRARQLVPGRAIIGATLRVRDISAVHARSVKTDAGRSAFIAPSKAHGMWLEFREPNETFAGKWNVTVRFGANQQSALWDLTEKNGKYEGASGPLDELGVWPLNYSGTFNGKRLALTPTVGELKKPIGALDVALKNKALSGNGTLYGVPVTLIGVRPSEQVHEPKTHEFVPKSYVVALSGRNEPVLHINPGDSVKTTTVDANGQNGKREWVSMPGNPHTGPFFIDGAMPGDTLVVHLTQVRMNSDRATMWCRSLNENALPNWREPEPRTEGKPNCDREWIVDVATQTAKPAKPSERLKDFSVPLRPMIGSIGVAPPWNQAVPAGDLGLHGGNLDYNRIVEGATLYLPVFRAGALFSLGDGHAVQGDGEITGQGLETSLAVEFKVDLIKGKAAMFPWAEDAEYYMFSGIGNSIENALQAATGNLYDWLKDRYGLEQSDVTMLLGTSIQYDIAEIVDPRPHVVAKLRKDTLSKIHKP